MALVLCRVYANRPLVAPPKDALLIAVEKAKEAVNGNVFYRRWGKEFSSSAVSRFSLGSVRTISLDAVSTFTLAPVRRITRLA